MTILGTQNRILLRDRQLCGWSSIIKNDDKNPYNTRATLLFYWIFLISLHFLPLALDQMESGSTLASPSSFLPLFCGCCSKLQLASKSLWTQKQNCNDLVHNSAIKKQREKKWLNIKTELCVLKQGDELPSLPPILSLPRIQKWRKLDKAHKMTFESTIEIKSLKWV